VISPRQRILIALDPAAPLGDALEAVAALCRRGEADLTAVFIEDQRLTRLASLPFAREVRLGGQRVLDADILRLQLDACATEFEAAFARAKRMLQLEIRLQILRGDVLAELRKAAAEVDLLVIGRSRKTAGARTWLGVTPERLAEAAANGPVPVGLLFVHEPWATGRSVLLVSDGSEAASRAFAQATAIAEADELPLEICRLADRGNTAPTDQLPLVTDLASLRRLCAAHDPRLLVIPDSPRVRARIDIGDLLLDLPASVAITP